MDGLAWGQFEPALVPIGLTKRTAPLRPCQLCAVRFAFSVWMGKAGSRLAGGLSNGHPNQLHFVRGFDWNEYCEARQLSLVSQDSLVS